MNDDIIDEILHTTGYLPPRNEKEMIDFEKEYSKIEIDCNFHVDVNTITSDQQKRLYDDRFNELMQLSKETLVELILGRKPI